MSLLMMMPLYVIYTSAMPRCQIAATTLPYAIALLRFFLMPPIRYAIAAPCRCQRRYCHAATADIYDAFAASMPFSRHAMPLPYATPLYYARHAAFIDAKRHALMLICRVTRMPCLMPLPPAMRRDAAMPTSCHDFSH